VASGMSSPRVARTPHTGKGASIRHVASHAHLLHDASQAPAPSGRSRRGRPDAIVVPAARPASFLSGIIELAAAVETEIVVLCSFQANVDQVADRIGRVRGARGLVIPVDDDTLPAPTFETSSPTFTAVSDGRASDLSRKRNLALLLARLQGWRKIVFIDDDISLSRSDIARLSDQLNDHQIVGMMCTDFPDNSVFCHARRLARLHQEVFVTGAVLGVNTADLPLPFFPDIYNEDWFFFADAVAHRRLTNVGEARQAPYDPFTPRRARHEEFGDLLAEGLYLLLEDIHRTARLRRPGDFFPAIAKLASEKYWTTFIDVRRQDLAETRSRLCDFIMRDHCSDSVFTAIKSLEAADALYASSSITAPRCTEFLEAWVRDMARWNAVFLGTANLGTVVDAMDWLGIGEWERVR
jgi:hypothetical protein